MDNNIHLYLNIRLFWFLVLTFVEIIGLYPFLEENTYT